MRVRCGISNIKKKERKKITPGQKGLVWILCVNAVTVVASLRLERCVYRINVNNLG